MLVLVSVTVGICASLHTQVNIEFTDIATVADGSYIPFHFGVEYPLAALHVIV